METGTQHPEPFSGRPQGGATGEAKEKAEELTRTTRDRALSTLDRQKEQVSGLLERVADAVQDDRLGGYASEYARRGAELLRRQSADELFRSVRRGFRSRPGVVLSACFVAGLAFARLMKGSTGNAWGERSGFGGQRFDAARWRDRGYGESRYTESGYGEDFGAAPEPTRAEPWREGEP